MAQNSKIQWTDHTINFWTGCHKVSPGCKYCYMYRDKERYGKDPSEVIRVKPSTINKVLKEAQPGDKVFTCSWSDFFIEEADPWREEAWEIIRNNPQLTWQILTKRPERLNLCLPRDWGFHGYKNVWLGVSVESQEQIHRIVHLDLVDHYLDHHKNFISYEPALGPLNLMAIPEIKGLGYNGIDWLIVGGESGNDNGKYLYRTAELEWFHSILMQCRDLGIPVFVKQLGTGLAKQMGLKDRHGGDISEWPEWLQVREFPR
jgi:protein gp37